MAMDSRPLSILNASPAKLPGPELLHELVRPASAVTALEHTERGIQTLYTYTYTHLHKTADVIAHRITEAGNGSGSSQQVVPLLIEQSPTLYAAQLGILKAGAAFCPLNIDAPPDRVSFILQDVAAQVVLASKDLATKIPPQCKATVLIVDFDSELSNDAALLKEPRHYQPSPEDLSYVMYTSGSTGTPKGVGISHRAATQALLAHDSHVPTFSRFLQFAAPTFDVSVFEIFFPLFRGSTLVSARRAELLNDLPKVIREMEVDACELTPTVAASLLKKREFVPKLGLLLTIGEMLNAPVVEEFGGNGERESILWAMYGPTEATIHCTLQSSMSVLSTVNNIGVPLKTVSCFVIEPASDDCGPRNFRVLPQGDIGELAVGGHQLAHGYINREEQTAAAFIESPYGLVYRTGDKARLLADGTIECLGRLSDGQVKLRGQRLELGEVEQAMMRASGCFGAVALVENSNLVGFCAADERTSEEDVLQACQKWLPLYMIPNELIIMREFPRLPSGKADKKTLIADYRNAKSENDLRSGHLERISPLQRRVLDCVSEVLHFQVEPETKFSHAGLDSLKAILLSSSVKGVGVDVQASDILLMDRVSDLLSSGAMRTNGHSLPKPSTAPSLLSHWDDIVSVNPTLADVRDSVEDVHACTPLQLAMLSETARQPSLYWNEVEFEDDSGCSAEQMTEAFESLIFNNCILRTGFLPWRNDFVSIVFNPDGKPHAHDLPNRGLGEEVGLSEDDALLRPFRFVVQVQPNGRIRLKIRIHHAIYDGWSMDLILSDLQRLLQGLHLDDRLPYRSLISLYNAGDRAGIDSDAEMFWKQHLLDWHQTPFPKLRENEALVDEILVVETSFNMAPMAVQQLASKVECSAQVFFQAALALTWSGILGNSDVVVGSVTSGRTVGPPGIEGVIGPCIASLPLRINLNENSSELDLLHRIHTNNRAMMRYSSFPLSLIRKLAGIQPGEAIYDVLFVYQESPYSISKTNSSFREIRHLDRLETRLLFEVTPGTEGYTVQATYHSGSITTEMVRSLIDQVSEATTRMVSTLSESLAQVPCSSSIQLSVYNEEPQSMRGIPDLARMVQKSVTRDPNAEAICFSTLGVDGRLRTVSSTFQELNDWSNRIAHYLRSRGAQTGQIVGIIMEKSPLLYASILAVVKAGCGYLPLLPSTPLARVQTIAEQAGLSLCLTDDGSEDVLHGAIPATLVNISHARLGEYPYHNLDIPPDGSRIAYVIYTSGTTGTPKGVACTQLNLSSNISHLLGLYPQSKGKQSRLLQACSQAFDVSVFEIFYTWCAGMCLCSGTNDTLFSDLEFAIREMDVTHLSLTPTVASLIDPRNVPSVEFLVTSGEPMTQAVYEKWGSLLWQGYGPSETTNICSVKPMGANERIEHLGWAFPNTSVLVLPPGELAPLPIGWVGELCFGGDQVADGYLNMPQLTGDKFVHHAQYGRIYRSGDMGRMLSNGSLVILGRLDDQLKLRGQRIEAAEVNSIITTKTEYAFTAVTLLAKRRDSSSEQLISYYVPSTAKAVKLLPQVDQETNQALFSALSAHLPMYMIPSYLIPISRVPRTSSGKVDRRQLVQEFSGLEQEQLQKSAHNTRAADKEQSWTVTERKVAAVIESWLNADGVQLFRWTPFATLGIDSISAISLARTLSEKLTQRVTISAILRAPSVAELSRFLESDSPQKKPSSSSLSPFNNDFISKVKDEFASRSHVVEHILPCAPLQEAMLSGASRGYYNKVLFRLQRDVDQMKGYWAEISRRHGILRTCFVSTDNAEYSIAQVVLHDWEVPWRYIRVEAPAFDHAINNHLQMLPEPVDSGIPPVSLAIIKYRGSDFLSFICHHALYDGVAMDNLFCEIESLAREVTLAPAPSYQDFLDEALNLPVDYKDFWSRQLQGHQPAMLFRKSSAKQVYQATYSISLEMPLQKLQERIRSLNISMLSLCQAAWFNTLYAATQTPDVCFGNVVSGRIADIDGVDNLVAPCFNTVPLRTDMSKVPHGAGLLKKLHQLNVDLMPYQHTPLRAIQKMANRQGRGLFDTLLLLQQPLREMDASLWILEEDSGDMDIPLVCEVVPCPNLNSVLVNIHNDMDTVGEDVASIFGDVFEYLVRGFLESPYAPVRARSTLPASLQERLRGLRIQPDKHVSQQADDDGNSSWSLEELKIRDILSKLSEVPLKHIARSRSIYQLGLDSINAVQIASLLRREGFDLMASDVIENPTCAKLAKCISGRTAQGVFAVPKLYSLQAFALEIQGQVAQKLPASYQAEAVLPCTPMQSSMLSLFLQAQQSHYFNAMSFHMASTVSVERLTGAWAALQHAHPMLRTGFVPINHRDCAFAMVRQAAVANTLPLTVVNDNEQQPLDTQEWKLSLSRVFKENTHIPPWHVILNDSPGGLKMTLYMHHALYDARSLKALLQGLSVQLQGTRQPQFGGVEDCLCEIMFLSQDEQKLAAQFWEGYAASTVVNSFPTLTPLREDRGSLLSHAIQSRMPFADLEEAASKADVSIQALVQAAWTRILSSYLGEASVVFGTVLSGRTSDATNNAPFPCITTIPVVATNSVSNAELMKQMMRFNSSLHKYQYAPLSQIQRWLGHPASPVFDTLLSYHGKPETPDGRQLWMPIGDDAMVEYPVSIEVEPQPGGEVRLCITHNPEVVPAEQAAILLKQFDAVMSHLALHPDGRESDLSESRQDLFAVLPAQIPVMEAPVKYLHEFVEMQAKLQPHKIALEFVDGLDVDEKEATCRQWSYQGLDEMGNRVANMLADEAPVNSIVAIHLDKSPEAYFAILGILKAGCSFVALDPTAPEARKAFILEDSNAPCLLTTDAHRPPMIGNSNIKVLSINNNSLQPWSTKPRDIKSSLTPDATCYCLYTSGTTGTPKGCEITHDNAVQAMMAFQHLFSGHWEEDSRWLQFAALHFDVSVLEQYWSWGVGITVVAAAKDLILEDLTGFISTLDITHIDLTPSLARLTHPDEVPSLCRGVFITGGESLKQEILDAWGPRAVIYNAYGPTEATIGVTMYQRVPINGRPSNIGKQFPNVGSYVFQPGTENPVLKGGVGELCVSGKLVGKGYLGRPELTEERFPVLKAYRDRIYRTGDLVRVLHDGCFDFLGRADDQVKLRGQRLEIGEINHAIRGVPEIRDVATVVAGSGDKTVLVSFLVSTTPAEETKDPAVVQDAEGLGSKAKAACREKLPGYMVPTYCLVLPFIPLSSNNKAEVKQLKQLFGNLSHEQLMRLSPSVSSAKSGVTSATMHKIIDTLADFGDLSAGDISPSTSIFDIGVDSISVLRLDRLLKAQGLGSSKPAVILRNPIVDDLAAALSSVENEAQSGLVREAKQRIQAYQHRYRSLVSTELGVPTDEIEYVAPCSPLQEGILAKSLTGGAEGSYFNALELHLSETVSVKALRSAWDRLVAAEAILRTAFVNTPDGFAQVALKRRRTPWLTRDVQSSDKFDQESSANRSKWIKANSAQVHAPFQLLLVEGPGSRRLVIYMFHALYDGNSFNILLERLCSLLKGTDLPPSPSFLDALGHGPLVDHSHCKNFWLGHLKDWSPSPMPILSTQHDSRYAMAFVTMPAKMVEDMQRAHRATLQSVLLAAWACVLQKYHPEGVSLGVIVSGRSIDLPGVERTNGPLFNTVPFFFKPRQNESWASLVRSCHDYGASILASPHVSLQSIQKWCSQGKPLFDTLFTIQIDQHGESEHDLWQLVDAQIQPDYPLALEIVQTKDGLLRMSLVAQGHIADELALNELLQKLKEIITVSQAEPDRTIRTANALMPSTNGFVSENPPSETRQKTELQATADEAFHWSSCAVHLRDEMAALAGIPAAKVTEVTTILELGLDSIDVIKLSAKIKQRGIRLSPAQIMQFQSIAGMVASIGQGAGTSTHTDAKGIHDGKLEDIKRKLSEHIKSKGFDSADIEEILPPTPLQDSMVAAMVESDFEVYFNHDILEVQQGIDIEQLGQAWTQVIASNAILRTGFVPVYEQDVNMAYGQVVYKNPPLSIRNQHLGSISEVDHIIKKNIEKASESRGRKDLLQLSFLEVDGRHLLLISIAHALYDGWSMSLMYQAVYKAYHGERLMAHSSQPFLSRMISSKTPEADKFWSDHLRDASLTTIPAQRTNADDGNIPNVYKVEKRSAKPTSDILGFCKSQSVSLLALCQACWALTLARLTKQLDVVFGMVMSGRDAEDTENLMFPTINTVAARYILNGSSGSFLRQVEDATRNMRRYQSYPLRKALTGAKKPGGGLFNSLFMMQKASDDNNMPQMLKSVQGKSALDYPVCVEAEAVGDHLIWRLACQHPHISQEDTEKVLLDLDTILGYLVSSPGADILAFTQDGVSICGLPTTSLKLDGDSHTNEEKTITSGYTWDGSATVIRKVLAEVSGVPIEQIGIHDTLFHLGLDSISAIKVTSLLRKESIRLSSRDLIVADSIQQMAEMARAPKRSLKQRHAAKSWTPPSDIDVDYLVGQNGLDKSLVEAVLPALPMQVYMVAAWQNAKGAIFYPEFKYLLKTGYSVTEKHIKDAWQSIVASTPMLRTTLVSTTSRELPLLQVVTKATDTTASLIPRRLWSFSASANGTGEWILRLGIHHAMYDGVSLPAMMHRLASVVGCKSPQITPDDISPWAELTVSPVLGENKQKRRQFWVEYLRGCTPIPKWEARTDSSFETKTSHHVTRSAVADVAPIRQVAAAHGLSIQSLFLAAYAKVLVARDAMKRGADPRGRTPHDEQVVVFGIYLGNRSGGLDEADVAETFPRLNLVPLKVVIPRSGSVVDLASAIQGDIGEISSQGRADVGLWEIHQWTSLSMTSFVNFITLPDSDAHEDGSAVTLVPVEGVATTAEGSRDTSQIGDLVVRDAYLPALDVEASLRGGTLDIGVFGAAGGEAAALAEEITAVLVAAS